MYEGTCSLSRDIFASFPNLTFFFPPPPPQIEMTSILWSNPDFTRLSKTTNVNKKLPKNSQAGGGGRRKKSSIFTHIKTSKNYFNDAIIMKVGMVNKLTVANIFDFRTLHCSITHLAINNNR